MADLRVLGLITQATIGQWLLSFLLYGYNFITTSLSCIVHTASANPTATSAIVRFVRRKFNITNNSHVVAAPNINPTPHTTIINPVYNIVINEGDRLAGNAMLRQILRDQQFGGQSGGLMMSNAHFTESDDETDADWEPANEESSDDSEAEGGCEDHE